MLTLPQPSSTSSSDLKLIPVEEEAPIVEALLRAIMAKPLPPFESLESLELFARVADKYDMQGPISLARLATPSFLTNPIRVYAVACQYGWREEAVAASTKTPAFDIADPAVSRHFEGTEGTHVAALLGLHWKRKQGIDTALKSISAGNFRCHHGCGTTGYENAWMKLELRIAGEMTHDPSATFITNKVIFGWPESTAMRDWALKNPCTVTHGRRECCFNADVKFDSIYRQLDAAVDQLPKSI